MAWLFFDTRERGRSELAWLEVQHIERYPVVGRVNRLLNACAEVVQSRLGEIEGIVVVEGPGSFSSIRTGVLYANLFARLLRRPLVRLSAFELGALEELRDHLFSGEQQVVSYVAPLYDQEPNITLPKKA